MEKKKVEVLTFENRERAYEVINKSVALYIKEFEGGETK